MTEDTRSEAAPLAGPAPSAKAAVGLDTARLEKLLLDWHAGFQYGPSSRKLDAFEAIVALIAQQREADRLELEGVKFGLGEAERALLYWKAKAADLASQVQGYRWAGGQVPGAEHQSDRRGGGAGTPIARLGFILDELAKRYPAAHDPLRSDPPELRFLAAIDAASTQCTPSDDGADLRAVKFIEGLDEKLETKGFTLEQRRNVVAALLDSKNVARDALEADRAGVPAPEQEAAAQGSKPVYQVALDMFATEKKWRDVSREGYDQFKVSEDWATRILYTAPVAEQEAAQAGAVPFKLVEITSAGYVGWANLVYTRGSDWEGVCIAMTPPCVTDDLRRLLAATVAQEASRYGEQMGDPLCANKHCLLHAEPGREYCCNCEPERDGADAAKADRRAADPFKVEVVKMTESHRTTYWVRLTNMAIRPASADVLDDTGVISPYYSETEEHAIHTAKEWADFLGVPEQITCACLMCAGPSAASANSGSA